MKAGKYLSLIFFLGVVGLNGQIPDSLLATRCLDSVIIMMQQARPFKARDLGQRALDLRIRAFGPRHLSVAETYHFLGITQLQTGEFDQAYNSMQRALHIRRKHLAENDPALGATYNELGLVSRARGQLRQALEQFEHALSIYRSSQEEPLLHIADAYSNTGIVYIQLGNYDQALEYFQRVLSIRLSAQASEPNKLLATYNNIGVALWEQKAYGEALEYYQKALDLQQAQLGHRHPNVAATLHNMALLFDAQGDYQQALSFNQQALEIREETLGKLHPETAHSLENIGITFRKDAQPILAEEYLQRALSIRLRIHGTTHPDLGYIYWQLGKLSLVRNEIKEALKYFQQALSIYQEVYPTGHPELVSTQAEIGKALAQGGENKLALEHYEKAMAGLEEMRQNQVMESTRKIHLEEHYSVFEGAIQTLYQTHRAEPEQSDLRLAFSFAEKSKANLLRDAVNRLRAESFAGIPDSLLKKEENIKAAIALYEKTKYDLLTSGSAGDSMLLSYNDRLFDLRQAHRLLVDRFERDYPDYYRLKYDEDVLSVAAVQQLLAEDQCLIEYFVGKGSIYAFLITKNGFRLEVIPKDFPLNEWVQKLREGISGYFQSDLQTAELYDYYNTLLAQYAHRLYKKLIQPLGPLPKRLILVPDDILGYIPFGILLTEPPADKHRFNAYAFLIREHQIVYNFSATLWENMSRQEANTTGVQIFTPAFSTSASHLAELDPARMAFSPLQYNREEGRSIQELTQGQLWQGQEASVARFFKVAPQAAVLHLATHAQLDDRNMDYSFLVLAADNDPAGFDHLYIRDLYDLHLPAQMVVLSACETGSGELQKGEGIMSLARGFAYAGAKSMITSLWPVNDRSTSELMTLFYEKLQQGLSKDDALQQAKLAYLDQYKNLPPAHPFYWAGFIGMGDVAPLPRTRSSAGKLLVLTLAGLLALALIWKKFN